MPVQVSWSRAEEFFYDTFRPAAIVKIKSGIDSRGRIVLWRYHVYFAGERGAAQFYDVPHPATIAHGSGGTGPPAVIPSTPDLGAPPATTRTHAPAIVGRRAVIANAVFDATDGRLFQLPMTPDRVKAAIEKTR